MTEHINLETVDAYLASVIWPQGNTLPSPLVVLSDDTPLYDEPALLAEMEAAQAEERAAKLTAEIIDIETYNSNLITVTFSGIDLDRTYRVNVPRQLVQVGYLYNRLLNADACSILTESEVNLNRDFANDTDRLSGEFLPPFLSEDIMIRLKFPRDMSEDTRTAYNFILHDLSTDFTEGITKEEIRELVPKVRLAVTSAESREIRGDIVSLLLRLAGGKEEALVDLYKYAEQVEKAKETIDRNALLTEEERKAVIIFEYVSALAASLNPDILVTNITEIDKSMNPKNAVKKVVEESEGEAEAVLGLDSLFSDEDFQSSLNDIVSDFRKDNPESVTVTEDSTFEERIEYVTLPSNVVPMMGGLMTLSDRLNLDLYYSQNWNQKVSEEDAGTRGEFLIVLVLLTLQRMYMYGKSIDGDVEDPYEMKNLILALSTEGLGQPTDANLWFLRDSLHRAARGDNDNLNQFFLLSLDQTDDLTVSYFGQVMHWLGHTMIEDGHKKDELLTAFSGLPHFENFISAIYTDVEALLEEHANNDFSAEDDEEDEESEGACFVTNAVIDLFEEEAIDPQASDFALIKESIAALVRFAEFCLRKKEPTMREGSKEWNEALGLHMVRAIDD